ncbi:hypothetical protein [Actinocorallia libanotica]|uniref:Uncharacterized protein n=1 Tax=Actinocorallia libanotica TaxID=46162 RepID=A0ABN1Q186_9ACTN
MPEVLDRDGEPIRVESAGSDSPGVYLQLPPWGAELTPDGVRELIGALKAQLAVEEGADTSTWPTPGQVYRDRRRPERTVQVTEASVDGVAFKVLTGSAAGLNRVRRVGWPSWSPGYKGRGYELIEGES